MADGGRSTILNSDVKRIVGVRRHDEAVRAGVDLLVDQARVLMEGSSRPDVLVYALPKPLIEKVVNARGGVRRGR